MILDFIRQGDVLDKLKDFPTELVQTVVTSPPYWALHDYGVPGQIGLEPSIEEYVDKLVDVFRDVKRILKPDGTLFLNLGDTYFSGGPHADAYGTSGTERKDFQGSGCLCENLCDECLAAFLHSPRIFRERVSKLPSLPDVPIPENTASMNGLPPTSDSIPLEVHKATAKRRQRPSFRRDRAQVPGVLLSTKNGSSPQPQEGNRPSDTPSFCRNEDAVKTPGAHLSVDRRVCICGTSLPLFSLVCRISGKAHNVGPYQYLTKSSLKPKDLCMIPARVALALQADGWFLRSDIIWSKNNPMPESVTDRPTKSHEYLFLLAKSESYYYDAEAIKEPAICGDPRKPYAPGQVDARGDGHNRGGGKIRPSVARGGFDGKNHEPGKEAFRSIKDWRNKRTVWTVPTCPFPEAHFATFLEKLIEPCILAGSRAGDIVFDPFMGAGTTALVAAKLNRHFLGVEINPEYIKIAERRIASEVAQKKMF